MSDGSLRRSLLPPVTDCVETGVERSGARAPARRPATGRLALTIRTLSAYRLPIGRVFVDALADRTALSSGLAERVHTAVQEALMNAVLHGSLKVDSSQRGSLDGLMRMHEDLDEKLARPEVSAAAITVEASWDARAIHVTVGDSGEGYDAGQVGDDHRPLEAERPCGRGLAILVSICDEFSPEENGRVAKMSFLR